MTKTTKTLPAAAPVDTGTAPTAIGSSHAIDVVNPERRRPVLALNADGELVVCCRRTARKHGWKIEGAMFQRTRSAKRAAAAAEDKGLAVSETGKLVRKPAKVVIANAVQENLIADLLASGKGK